MADQCPSCRADLTSGAHFCAQCGAAIPPAPIEQDWVALSGGDVPAGAQDGAPSDHQPNPPAMGHDEHVASPAMAPPHGDVPPAPAGHDAYAELEAARSGGSAGGGIGKWLLALAALAIIGGFGWWAWQWARVPQTAQIDATAPAEPVIAPPADWRPTYVDTFLSENVEMTTGVDANLRDYPSAEGTSITRIVPTGRRLAGRWVRSQNGNGRWLKLNDGGYVWEGDLTAAAPLAPPISITLTGSGTLFGPQIGAYIDRARVNAEAEMAQAEALPEKERMERLGALETGSNFVRVPNRRFEGLTVTAVGLHYESMSVYFSDPAPAVIETFRAQGRKIDSTGVIEMGGDDADICTITPAQSNEERRYGATALTCGH